MKSIFICSALLLTVAIPAFGQDSAVIENKKGDYHWVELGIRFMPTFSKFNLSTPGSGVVQGEGTLGWGFGGMLAINFSRHVGFQGELIYNTLSQKFKDQALDKEINVKYVNIPLMLALNSDVSKPVNFRLAFGPQLGYNTGSSVKSTGGSSDTITTIIATKRSDFGLSYGAGLGFKLGEKQNIRMDLGFRGVYGLINVANNTSSNADNTVLVIDNAKIRTYSAYLGFTLLF